MSKLPTFYKDKAFIHINLLTSIPLIFFMASTKASKYIILSKGNSAPPSYPKKPCVLAP
jgi:hypothetical protein